MSAAAAPQLLKVGNRFMNWFLAAEGAEALAGPFSGLDSTLKTLGVIDAGVKVLTGRDLVRSFGEIAGALFKPTSEGLDKAGKENEPFDIASILERLNRILSPPDKPDEPNAENDRKEAEAKEKAKPGSLLEEILARWGNSSDVGQLAWKAGIGGVMHLYNQSRKAAAAGYYGGQEGYDVHEGYGGYFSPPGYGIGHPLVMGPGTPWVDPVVAQWLHPFHQVALYGTWG